jgi:hypothetical protein
LRSRIFNQRGTQRIPQKYADELMTWCLTLRAFAVVHFDSRLYLFGVDSTFRVFRVLFRVFREIPYFITRKARNKHERHESLQENAFGVRISA